MTVNPSPIFSYPNVATWIPNADLLSQLGEDILALSVQALALYGLDGRYERQVVAHGVEVPVAPSNAAQISVCCPKVFLGRAGSEQFSFLAGNIGQAAFQVAQFVVEVSAPYPRQQSPTALAVDAITAHRRSLWHDAWIVWAALIGSVLGGVTPPVGGVPAREMIVGPMTAKGPLGGEASWSCEVQVQL